VLEDNRQRKSEQVKNEREEESDITLEQQRLHNLRRQQNAAQNPVQRCYKDITRNI
jgi:septal ring factor EnvC (AmiA/AmiB activator)